MRAVKRDENDNWRSNKIFHSFSLTLQLVNFIDNMRMVEVTRFPFRFDSKRGFLYEVHPTRLRNKCWQLLSIASNAFWNGLNFATQTSGQLLNLSKWCRVLDLTPVSWGCEYPIHNLRHECSNTLTQQKSLLNTYQSNLTIKVRPITPLFGLWYSELVLLFSCPFLVATTYKSVHFNWSFDYDFHFNISFICKSSLLKRKGKKKKNISN